MGSLSQTWLDRTSVGDLLTFAGVAPDATLMACKGLNDKGTGSTSDLASCMYYSASQGAQIVSNSWGGCGNADSEAAVLNVVNAFPKVLFVFAAGNDGVDVEDVCYTDASGVKYYYGAPSLFHVSYPNMISVGAVNIDDNRPWWSNYGSKVAVMAPGSRIVSTFNNGSWAMISGTSMATPHVAGAAALLYARYKTVNDVFPQLQSGPDSKIDKFQPLFSSASHSQGDTLTTPISAGLPGS